MMNVEQLEARVQTLENRLRTLEDIEAIQKVQRAYGYYLEHIMYNEVADLWTDDGEMQWLGFGVFKGKEAIRKQWKAVKERFQQHDPPNYMHLAPQSSPYITVAPDGKTAYGRWYTIMGVGMSFLYETTYVKEDGVWKIKVLQSGELPVVNTDGTQTGGPGPRDSDEAERERHIQEYMGFYKFTERWSRVTRQEWPPYIRPFSFRHPVTGKKTSEDEWNKAHPCPMPPGGENWVKSKK